MESTLKRRRLATRVSRLLASDPAHSWPLMEEARRLLQLERKVLAALDPELGRHCRVAAFRDGDLLLLAASPAWATRLRYAAPAIVEQLRGAGGFPGVRKVRVRVHAGDRPKPPDERPGPRLSRANAELIEQTALSLARGTLRDALLRLAGRAGKKR